MHSSSSVIFQALAEPRRREMVEMIARKGALSASEIGDKFPVSAAAVSQHLKVLRGAKLVKVERRAQMRIYRIDVDGVEELERWVRRLRAVWEERFLRLDVVLSRETKP